MKWLVVLALLLGAVRAHAQTAAPPPAAPTGSATEAPIAAPQAPPPAAAPSDAAATPAAAVPTPASPPAPAPGSTAAPYAPAPYPPWYPAYARRSMLETELTDLQRRRSELGLGGPIAAVIAGGAVLAASAGILLVALAMDSNCSHYEYDYSYYDDYSCDDGAATTLYIVGGFGAVLGGLTLAYGIFRLVERGSERRALGRRMKEIRRELGYAAHARLDVRFSLGSDRAGLRLQARF